MSSADTAIAFTKMESIHKHETNAKAGMGYAPSHVLTSHAIAMLPGSPAPHDNFTKMFHLYYTFALQYTIHMLLGSVGHWSTTQKKKTTWRLIAI